MARQLRALQRIQSLAKVMMPHTQYDAPRCKWGVASNDNTDQGNSDGEVKDQEDQDNPHEHGIRHD
jgi:hypothetical protein